MALEKPIIKAQIASHTTFEYKPREFSGGASAVARSFVDVDAFRSKDFKISQLIAEQAGISQLESDAVEDKINLQVLARLKDVEQRAFEEGYEIGLIEGTEKAFQQAKGDLQARLIELDTMLKNIEKIKSNLLMTNEAEIIRLVYLTAKKMALRDLQTNREAVAEILATVVGEAQANERIVVRLSPEDLLFIESLQDKSGQKLEAYQRLKLVPEDNIKSGGCLIETEYGSVDATVEERVDRTWAALLSRIPQVAPGSKE
jgi:flagellar assembly protein FliH